MPDTVTDDRVLVEVVRAWYGTRDPIANPSPEISRLIEHMSTSRDALAPGPPLPLPLETWSALLSVKMPAHLPAALTGSRDAMLLYHGLMGMDDESLAWMRSQTDLLEDILERSAAPFSFAAPSLRVRQGVVEVPGGAAARRVWEDVVGASPARPQRFIRELMAKNRGRTAWLYSMLSDLDPARLRFAAGEGGAQIERLARLANEASPEWLIAERPFWRPAFDLSLVLSLIDPQEGALRGSDEFWREVFHGEDLQRFEARRGVPLTSASLVSILFEQPFTARDRWEVFMLGQRIAAVGQDSADAGLVLRGAREHPALGRLLDRLKVDDLKLRIALHLAAARVTSHDETGARGDLGMWQASLAIIERGALTGGFDAAQVARTLSEFASIKLDEPAAALTAWLMRSLIPALMSRPGAPPTPELAIIEMMSGLLTPAGRGARPAFTWEDLPYALASPESVARRMRVARAAQDSLTLDDAKLAWDAAEARAGDIEGLAARLRASSIPGAAERATRLEEQLKGRDASGIRREAQRTAEWIASALLPALAYAPHLAVTDAPELGAEVAFRHTFGTQEDGAGARRTRPWLIARGYPRRGEGWNLQGSMLLLDVAVANWYLRRNDEPPMMAPAFDEMDVAAMAQVAAMTRSGGAAALGLAEAVSAMEAGTQRARASRNIGELDDLLRAAGTDPWRRREIRLAARTPEEAAAALSRTERWRLGGARGSLSPRVTLDGCVCLGATPPSLFLEGRRSAGLVGAGTVDAQLRVAEFLRARTLPDDLFGEVLAGVLADVVDRTRATRPDDFRAIALTVDGLDDTRLEEHLLALVADGTLARPSQSQGREH